MQLLRPQWTRLIWSQRDGLARPVSARSGVKWSIVLAGVLTAALEVRDSTIVNLALPHMMAAFGVTSDQRIWILTSHIVASVVAMPLTGFFAKRFGRWRLIITAIGRFAVDSILHGLASCIRMMLACRLGQGLFCAILIPLSYTILFDSFPRENRGQTMALFGIGGGGCPHFEAVLGPVRTAYSSWRAAFIVNLPIVAFALTMVTGQLDGAETKAVTVDWTRPLLMVATIGAGSGRDDGPVRFIDDPDTGTGGGGVCHCVRCPRLWVCRQYH